MTGREFDAIRPLLNISEDRVNAARAALVDGQTLQGVANLYGWGARQSVGDAVRVVWKTFAKYNETQRAAASAGTLLPPGWEQVTLIAPSHLIEAFRQQIAAGTGAEPAHTAQPARKTKKKSPERVSAPGQRQRKRGTD
jgi:hypothetical protein